MRNPVGLAALACIITSTPGTAWAGYDPSSGVLTMHILDLVDDETWVHTIKDRYERYIAWYDKYVKGETPKKTAEAKAP